MFLNFLRFVNTNASDHSPSTNRKEKSNEAIQLKELNNFNLINDWNDLKTRNIAYGAVIYDEFLKELASICQEHCIQQC